MAFKKVRALNIHRFLTPSPLYAFVRFAGTPISRVCVLLSHQPSPHLGIRICFSSHCIQSQYITQKSKIVTVLYRNQWELVCIVVEDDSVTLSCLKTSSSLVCFRVLFTLFTLFCYPLSPSDRTYFLNGP